MLTHRLTPTGTPAVDTEALGTAFSELLRGMAQTLRSAVDAGEGLPFAPNGRVFREWLAVPVEQHDRWAMQVQAAYDFVAGR